MKKTRLVIKRIKFDVDGIAEKLYIDHDTVIKSFTDGRTASRFTELWSSYLYNFRVHESACVKDSDGIIECIGDFKFLLSAKCLTKGGIRFQSSRFQGKGRKCTIKDLASSLEKCDRIAVIDIREFPMVSAVMIDSKLPLKWMREEKLTDTGLKANKFYSFLQDDFVLVEEFNTYNVTSKLFEKTDDALCGCIKEIKCESTLAKYEDFVDDLS